MASLTFVELYLHDAADLTDYLALPVNGISDSPTQDLDVRTYAGGRRRVVRRPSLPRQVSVDFAALTTANREALQAWIGTLLLLRDLRGRKFYGVYDSLNVSEIKGMERAAVSLAFTEVTFTEEV